MNTVELFFSVYFDKALLADLVIPTDFVVVAIVYFFIFFTSTSIIYLFIFFFFNGGRCWSAVSPM